MIRRILRTGLIISVETALLLVLAATWGIPGARRPAASTDGGVVPTFDQSIQTDEIDHSLPFGLDWNR